MAVLDTNFLIAVEQGDEGAVTWLEKHRGEEHHVPDFVAVEYLTGVVDVEEGLAALEQSFVIAHGDADWLRAATRLRRVLRKKRVRFRTPDFWVAAWAHHLAVGVCTRDGGHFGDLGVPIEAW